MLAERKLPKTRCVIRVDEIVRQCEGKKVLNIGMGGWLDNDEKFAYEMEPDALLDSVHYRISKVASEVVGTDINQQAIDRMQALVPGKYVQSDLMDRDFASKFGDKFEIVVFGEVLEHLDDLRSALQNIKSVLQPGGKIVLTTANAFSADRIAKMFAAYEACHLEHTSYFSFVTIRRLLQMNGLKIDNFNFYVERPPRNRSIGRATLYQALRAIGAVMPQFGEGIIVVTSPEVMAA